MANVLLVLRYLVLISLRGRRGSSATVTACLGKGAAPLPSVLSSTMAVTARSSPPRALSSRYLRSSLGQRRPPSPSPGLRGSLPSQPPALLRAAPGQARRAARLHPRPVGCHHLPRHCPLLCRRPRRRRHVARHVAATASNAYTHVWAQLSIACSALAALSQLAAATTRQPASTRGSSLLPPPPSLLPSTCPSSRFAQCADEMLSRVVCLLVMKPARMAYILTSATGTAGPLRYVLAVRQPPSPAPYTSFTSWKARSPPKSWRRSM